MAEKIRERPPLLPGQPVPAWYDEEQVKKDEARTKKQAGLFVKDAYDPDDPWKRLDVRLNPNSKAGALLEGIPYNVGDAQTVLLMAIYEQLAGGDVVDEKERARLKREREEDEETDQEEAAKRASGPVAGGSPEGPASRSPTTGPSATGGTTTTPREDAEAAAGASAEQRRAAERQAQEKKR